MQPCLQFQPHLIYLSSVSALVDLLHSSAPLSPPASCFTPLYSPVPCFTPLCPPAFRFSSTFFICRLFQHHFQHLPSVSAHFFASASCSSSTLLFAICFNTTLSTCLPFQTPFLHLSCFSIPLRSMPHHMHRCSPSTQVIIPSCRQCCASPFPSLPNLLLNSRKSFVSRKFFLQAYPLSSVTHPQNKKINKIK